MPPFKKHRGSHKPKALSLERFAAAKTSGYDKKRKLEKERALQAKKVNKYRKLKAKLQREGKLQPRFQLDKLAEQAEREDEDTYRARTRAGPAPGDPSGDEDAVGASDSDIEDMYAAEQPLQHTLEALHDGSGQQALLAASKEDSEEDSDEGERERQDGSEDADEPESRAGHRHPAAEQGVEQPSTSGHGLQQQYRQQPAHIKEQRLHHQADRQPQQHGARTYQKKAGKQGRKLQGKHPGPGTQQLAEVGQHTKEQRQPGLEPAGKVDKKQKWKKPAPQVQRLAAVVQASKEATEKAREEARQAAEAHRTKVETVEKQRKQQTNLFRKRTKRGQPVMKYRIDKILSQLEKS